MISLEKVPRLRKRDYRRETRLTIVEGYPEVSRAVKAGIPVETLFICPEILQLSDTEFSDQPIVEITKDEFAQIAFGERLKGVLAICRPKQYQLSDLSLSNNPFIVILEGVEKPGNLGGVIRTCDGAGVDAVIMCDGRTDVYNHNVVRSSIGTVFTVPTIAASKEEILAFLKKNNICVYAATSHSDQFYTDYNLSAPTALILGSEHAGISPFWLEHADHKVKIPMLGQASCLNVAASAAILIYEALRQRR